MAFRNTLKLGVFSSIAATALFLTACGGSDGGGGGSDQEFVDDICAAGLKFSEDFTAALSDEDADPENIADTIVKPFETFAKAVEDANPPDDLKDWHSDMVDALNKLVKTIKDGDEDAIGAALEEDPISDPPAAAAERLEKLAADNKDCQAADFAFGSDS